jgi:hypothetical protein
MSADSVMPDAAGTQGYNLYAYAANNPIRWVDPTGHFLPIPQFSPLFVQSVNVIEGMCVRTTWCPPILFGLAAAEVTALAQVPYTPPAGVWAIQIAAAIFVTIVAGEIACPGLVALFTAPHTTTPTRGRPATDPTPQPTPPAGPVPIPRPPPGCGGWAPGPYLNLPDLPGALISPGLPFSQRQRAQIIAEDIRQNGTLVSDGDGGPLTERAGSDRSAEVDHICPATFGGPNSNPNACLLSRGENRRKSNNPPFVCPRRAPTASPPAGG